MSRRRNALALVALLVIAAACGGRPPLPAKSSVVPDGVDLTGQWQMRNDSRESNRRLLDAERKAAGGSQSLLDELTGTKSKRKDDIFLHVFIRTGESLKLTQTDFGLFISFDRAIVEEYRFGEQRTVNVGAVVGERVSGWEEGAYVIVTRDKEGAMLVESYQLEDDNTLHRGIRIIDAEYAIDIDQYFDRR